MADFLVLIDPRTGHALPLRSRQGKLLLKHFVKQYLKYAPSISVGGSVPHTQWTLYILPTCPYCIEAQQLVTKMCSDPPREMKLVVVDSAQMEQYKQQHNHPSFPIIYHHMKKIGGLDNLKDYLKV